MSCEEINNVELLAMRGTGSLTAHCSLLIAKNNGRRLMRSVALLPLRLNGSLTAHCSLLIAKK
jgi:hypothetical protein